MEDGIINISELKTGQKFTLEFGTPEPTFTKLDEPGKFLMEDWFEDEVEIFIIEDRIKEGEPLHYAFEPMTLQEGTQRNEGKFGKHLVMRSFFDRPVDGIEMLEAQTDATEDED